MSSIAFAAALLSREGGPPGRSIDVLVIEGGEADFSPAARSNTSPCDGQGRSAIKRTAYWCYWKYMSNL